MRYVVKDENDKTALLSSKGTYAKLLAIINGKKKQLISDAIYRESYDTPDGRRSRVEDQLAIAYKNKCAYCERICKADIEHYRPKKGVEEDKDHDGYYWLCYEWTNLIPSCINCNREGGKHNQFPIIGNRVKNPLIIKGELDLTTCKAGNKPLLDEIPFLLHPEVDRPEDYFDFVIDPNGEGIRIRGIDGQNRGDRTIEICLLNRQEVKLDRVKNVIDDFKDSIQCLFVQLDNKELNNNQFVVNVTHHLKMLKHKSLQEDKTHTYLRKYIVASSKNFSDIVLPFLDSKIRNIVLQAFISLGP